jgi:phage-related protein
VSEFLPPVVAVLAADIAPYLAGLTEGQARMAEFVTTQNAAITELEARFETLGASGGLGAGMAAAAAEVETAVAGEDAALTKLGITSQSTAAEVQASFAEMGAAIEATGAKMGALSEENTAMAAKMSADNAAMAAASKEAALGQAALGDAMAGTGAKAEASSGALGLSKGAIIGIGAAAIGATYETAKMAGDFQQNVVKLSTSAGEAQGQLKMVGDGVLAMAGQVGYSSEELVGAMYKVESGGQHGAAALKVLQAAAEGAKAEQADLTTVADALTSAMTDYKVPADQAATVTSKLVAATGQGKMTFQELAGSMAAILPVASANHVSLNDILGDLASMTLHGMSAQQASQNLADAIRHMAAPTQAQSKELAALGMNATEVSKTLGEKGLSGTINDISNRITSQMGPDGMVVVNLTNALKGMAPPVQDLGKKVLDGSMSMKDFTAAAKAMGVVDDKNVMSFASLAGAMHGIGTEAKSGSEVYQTYSGALKAAMGDATGMNVALMIGAENADNTTKAIKAVSGATAEAGNHVKGWSEIQQEFNFKVAAAKDGLGAMAISIGEKLLPVLTPLVGMIAAGATWLSNHQAAATVLAFVLGGTLVVALVAGTVALWGFAAAGMAAGLAMIGITAPLWVVIAIVAAVGLAVYEIITHWQGIAGFFKGVWHAVQNVFEDALGFVMAPIHAIEKAWDSFMGGFQNPAAKLADTVKGFDRFFIEVGQKVKQGWDAVVRFFQQSPEKMADAVAYGLGRLTGIIVRFVESLPQKFGDFEHLLVTKGKSLLIGMLHGIEDGAKAVWDWGLALPGRIMRFADNADKWLVQKGKDALVGLAHGAEDGAKAVWEFLLALPGHVIDFFKAAPSWLYDAGKNILTGLWNGFTGKVKEVYDGVKGFISGIISSFMSGFRMSSPSQVMHEIGDGVIQGLWNGALGKIDGFLGWARGIPGSIVGAVGNLGTILYNAGAAAMNSLYNGFVAVWNSVKGWLSSVGGWIQSLKGPLDKDKTLLTPHGNAIMQGLMDGMKAQMPALRSQLGDVTKTLTTMGGTSQMGLSVSGTGSGSGSGVVFSPGAGAGGGGAVTNLHVTVNGSMWTTQTLMKEMQQAFLQHGIRNVTPGLQSGFA